MVTVDTLTEQIAEWKTARHAVILAHHYQDAEIQELADSVGDSLELARKAQKFEGEVIAFCGVWFMAETAKVLNPTRTVVVPDRHAGCSLVDSCPAKACAHSGAATRITYSQLHQHFRRSEGRKRHPLHFAQRRGSREFDSRRKADLCSCPTSISATTSRSRPAAQNMQIWQGACIVHATFPARRLTRCACRAPRRPGGRPSRVPLPMSCDWRISSVPPPRSSNGAASKRRANSSS